MTFFKSIQVIILPILVVTLVGAVTPVSAAGNAAENAGSNKNLAIIKGVVRDNGGNPIADATVALFKVGTTKVLREVRSAADGSFLLRIIPGKYTVLAVAQGFNPVTVRGVEVGSAAELNYGFKLERAGGGNTLPEKRVDRSNPKWLIRSSQLGRTIYQNREGKTPAGELPSTDSVDESLAVAAREDEREGRPGQSVIETYFASTGDHSYTGLNYATLLPVNENAEVLLAVQTGVGENIPHRFESKFIVRPDEDHQLRFNASLGSYGKVVVGKEEETLGQVSFQALDEWRVREGVVVVFGLDYSKFLGAGDDQSLTPRLGFQYDFDSKTRFRTAYTTQNEERTWTREIELENAGVSFREPVAIQDIVVEDEQPVMNRSTRFEFGVERLLDSKSSVEANAFFDSVVGRGVGLALLPLDSLGTGYQEFVGNQQGSALGLRVVYTRRLSGRFSAAGGYSFGSGQRLSQNGITDPDDLFAKDIFHTFFGQFEADLRSGTNVKTVFRLSPDATVFAIDPFRGRLAIYDPSLSILVTQALPTMGLPIRAEAIVDARNLFDFHAGVIGEEGGLRVNSQRRILRGGILVRF